eukprot:CAMPEP_0202413022 /NCGR_PEP_ID=MMETSP1128-20130828/27917_1 /ASSEMBLY_ACC=CAM_ASM_000463 /TAXON_ID=3047 /ORGANISM="Dunaliella tertiolecta, Strain CCMP1320" /LENGTH=33 /DNA_ID= /DNA_START= /DNA_END= /DNA_ORIENTATION=
MVQQLRQEPYLPLILEGREDTQNSLRQVLAAIM